MNMSDFAFIYQGNIINALTEPAQHYLLPIDRSYSENHHHALLLLHGFASSPAVYRAMIPLLKGYDRIVCPVLPGHSESIHAFAQATAKDWRNAAQQHCADLTKAYSKVSIVGLSLGGVLALELTQVFPIHHLYLLAPAFKLPYSTKLALIGAHLLKWIGCSSLKNVSGHIHAKKYQELSYRRLPITSIIEILTLIQHQNSLKTNCPTDIFLGHFDTVIDSHYVAQQFTNQAQTHIHWLDHSDHILPLDNDLEQILQCVNL